jgi:transposase
VFGCATAVLHTVAPSRGKAVVQEVLNGHAPAVWASDRFPAQTGHGASRQVCLADLLLDVQYAIDAGDTVFVPPIKSFLQRAVAIDRRRDELQDSTLYQYRCRLDRDLDEPAIRRRDSRAGEKLRRQIQCVHWDMLTFVKNIAVPDTNNASEQYLRPAVIFRKVIQGFRADWGADFDAGVRSVVDTGRLHGLSALGTIRRGLAQEPLVQPVTACYLN